MPLACCGKFGTCGVCLRRAKLRRLAELPKEEDEGDGVVVMISRESGEVAFGPHPVSRGITVAVLKSFFDADEKAESKKLSFDGKVLEDDETLTSWPAEVQLLVEDPPVEDLDPDHARWRMAAADVILTGMSSEDLLCFQSVEKPDTVMHLVYTGCLLALAAIHGEEHDHPLWEQCGGFPLGSTFTKCELERVTSAPCGTEVRRFRSPAFWPLGRVLAAVPIYEALRDLDHGLLSEVLKTDEDRCEELRELLAAPGMTSLNKGDVPLSDTPNAIRSKIRLLRWLEASVLPLVGGPNYDERMRAIRRWMDVSRSGKRPTDQLKAEECFVKWDLNEDGMITEDELNQVLNELDPRFNKDVVNELFLKADQNSDGCIHQHEFLAWIFG